ncbi:hypothetical protein [Persephonella sp.]
MQVEYLGDKQDRSLFQVKVNKKMLKETIGTGDKEVYMLFVEKVSEKGLSQVGKNLEVLASELTGVDEENYYFTVETTKTKPETAKLIEAFLRENIKYWNGKDLPENSQKADETGKRWKLLNKIREIGLSKAVDYFMADVVLQELDDDDYINRRRIHDKLMVFGYKDILFMSGKELKEYIKKHNIRVDTSGIEDDKKYVFADRPKNWKIRLFFQGMMTELSFTKALMGYVILVAGASVLAAKHLPKLKEFAVEFFGKFGKKENTEVKDPEKTVSGGVKPLSKAELALMLKNAGLPEEKAVEMAGELMEKVKNINSAEDFEKAVDYFAEKAIKAIQPEPQQKVEPQPRPAASPKVGV